jgi:uncharacterized membrane protein
MNTLLLSLAFVGWASWHLIVKAATRYISPNAAQLVYAISAGCLVPVYYTVSHKTMKFSGTGIAFAICAYLVATMSSLAYSYALVNKDVSSAVIFTAGYPLMTCLLAVPIFGEEMTINKCIGACLVIAGVMVANR